MKTKNFNKKLVLNKETIVSFKNEKLAHIVGGGYTEDQGCKSMDQACSASCFASQCDFCGSDHTCFNKLNTSYIKSNIINPTFNTKFTMITTGTVMITNHCR